MGCCDCSGEVRCSAQWSSSCVGLFDEEAHCSVGPCGSTLGCQVAKSEAFSEAVEKLWKLRAVSSAVGSLAELEDCFRIAAREVAVSADAHVKGLMKTKLYAATLMVHAVRSHDTGAARRALSLFPTLARYVDPSFIQGADVDGLYSFAARLNRADVENDLAAMARGCNDEGVRDDSSRDVRKASTLRRPCAWRLRRPRVQLRSIVGAEGELASSLDEAGEILAKPWQPVFEAREIDSEAADRFLSHVCAVGGGFSFELSREVVGQCILATKDSCPGPDGTPYAAWRSAGELAAGVVHGALCAVLEGGEDLPEQFNDANMVLLPKGEVEAGATWLSKSASDTRPLSVSNTDSKIFALVINRNLARLCEKVVSPHQRGFVKGRRIEECVLELESGAVCASTVSARLAATVLFDFKVAFPSLAHQWIYLVLERVGVPMKWIKFIKKLYKGCLCNILFAGAVCTVVLIESGIKQGCPASGSLFALVADPLIRFMLVESALRWSRILAYADDLALVCWRLDEQLPVVLEILRVWGLATALKLNPTKCVVIPLGGATVESIRAIIAEVSCEFAHCKVQLAGKYLGVFVGAGADDVQRSDLPAKVGERTAQIRAQHSGLVFSLLMFRVYVMSLLQYKARFLCPCVAMCKPMSNVSSVFSPVLGMLCLSRCITT